MGFVDFGNDPTLARSRNPHKNASFRALAEKCGTPELPVSKSWLDNAVGVALMLRQLPETAKVFKELLPSYQTALLPLRNPGRDKLFTLEGGKRSFTKADVEELDDEQRKKAIESAEGLIEKRRDLLGSLKKT